MFAFNNVRSNNVESEKFKRTKSIAPCEAEPVPNKLNGLQVGKIARIAAPQDVVLEPAEVPRVAAIKRERDTSLNVESLNCLLYTSRCV